MDMDDLQERIDYYREALPSFSDQEHFDEHFESDPVNSGRKMRVRTFQNHFKSESFKDQLITLGLRIDDHLVDTTLLARDGEGPQKLYAHEARDLAAQLLALADWQEEALKIMHGGGEG